MEIIEILKRDILDFKSNIEWQKFSIFGTNIEDAKLAFTDSFNNDAITLVAIENKKILGFSSFYFKKFRDDNNRIFISILGVLKGNNYAEISIGLLKKIEDKSKSMGVTGIYSILDVNNPLLDIFQDRNYEIERIELKRILRMDEHFNQHEFVHRVDAEYLQKHIDEFARLYLINDKAHILSDSSTLEEAYSQMHKLCQYLNDGKAYVLAALDHATICGVLWGFPYFYGKEKCTHVKQITVNKLYRGRGIAEKIYEQLFYELQQQQKNIIITNVDAANTSACHLYRKLKYEASNFQIVKAL